MSRIVDTIRREAPSEQQADRTEPTGPVRRGAPDLGIVQYFHMGDRPTVESVLEGSAALPSGRLRTAISWCDWMREGGEEWYEWLLPKLLEHFEVLPCFLYTPPELGVLPKTSSPPREPQAYGEFVEMVLRRHAGDFPYVELWNEPNNYIEWDWTIDPEWKIFAEMVGGAAERAAAAGVRSVLGGMSPFDPNWLDLMFKRGALDHVDVIGVHGFPGTWEAVWTGWDAHISRVEEVVERHGGRQRIWVTEAGYSTWAHDEFGQLTTLDELTQAPAERVYWYSVEDLAPERETLDGFHCDERAYHFGLQRRGGSPKLVARVLASRGLEGVREMVGFARQSGGPGRDRPGALITGGAGFIGSALADRLASSGTPVTLLDNLASAGVEESMRTLKQKHGDLLRVEIGDVRDVFAVRRALAGAERVFHLAARPETESLTDPRADLAVNLDGSINVLEEARRLEAPPAIVYASTSDVYGRVDEARARGGVTEGEQLSFRAPAGCSKGAADQYVLDYARSFGLRTCALRIGCVYGPRQREGWLVALTAACARGEPEPFEGDASELRDLLHVDDLVDALILASTDARVLAGRPFNIGGGRGFARTLGEIAAALGGGSEIRWSGARGSYVSDASAFRELTGWQPRVAPEDGLAHIAAQIADGDLRSVAQG